MPSDVVTWEACPDCAGPAALGWVGRTVVEIDCVSGCRLPESLRDAVGRTAAPPATVQAQERERPWSEA